MQRRVYTEQPEAVVDGPRHVRELAALIDGVIPARFRDWSEIFDWLSGDADHLGILGDEWIRIDQFTVLGESHNDSALELVKATGTKRFRYEGGGVWPQQVGEAAQQWADREASRHLTRLYGAELHPLLGGRNQRAEAIEPKLARVMLDIPALAASQAAGQPFRNTDLTPGGARPGGYSVAEALHNSLLAALVFVQSYQSHADDEIEAFYRKNADAIDKAAFRMLEADRTNVWPSYSDLMSAKVLESLGKALFDHSIASSPPEAEFEHFKAGLGQMDDEEHAAVTKQAWEADYRRDHSMLQSIRAANAGDDLMFIVGDEHLQKLKPFLDAEGIENSPWRQFKNEVTKENIQLADRLEPDTI